MVTLSITLTATIRIVLILLFLPFSALDKIINFSGAVAQAREVASSKAMATALIVAGLGIEVFMSLGIVTGVADRACAFVLAGYCGVTALLWKQFWRPGDFWASNTGQGRTLFWDFLKNFALGAGFLLISFGTDAGSVRLFLDHPLASSQPYHVNPEQSLQ
jgi:putative oxidoreductase